ncbi:MAG: putative Ig domain-containing protein, partial [Candidatus Acidiferrales bacterium]
MKISKVYARMNRRLSLGAKKSPPVGRQKSLAVSLPIILVAIFCALFVSGCGGGGSSITLEVTPKTATLDEGQSLLFIATLGNDTNNQGVTWTLTGSGCAGSGCGTLSNITTTSVLYTAPTGLTTGISVSLEAAANAHMNTTLTATVSIVLPVTFTTTTWPNGSNGVQYSATVVTTGGVPPVQYSLASGSLPAGLTINTAGTILGTPTSHGTSTFTIKATDNVGMTPNLVVASPTYTITINPAPPLAIPTSILPGGLVNTSYSAAIVPAGPGGVPPYTWSITSGTL